MMSHADLIQPPRIATYILTLFIPAEETESILGDLCEEYSHLSSRSGVAFARSCYWRQFLKTIAHLFVTAYCVAPWSMAAMVIGGYLLGGVA